MASYLDMMDELKDFGNLQDFRSLLEASAWLVEQARGCLADTGRIL
jgi:hypothetical protein